jgi:hypothetical protein
MADAKKKRSLREAFGVVRPPEETSASKETREEEDTPAATGPAGASVTGKASVEEEKSKSRSTRKKRASSGGNAPVGRSRAGRNAEGKGSGDPVITANEAVSKVSARTGEQGTADGRKKQPEEEMVPGKGGKMTPAGSPVNMTFTVTAKERYLWTLELKRRGLTAVGVLRETMEKIVGEDGL